MNLQPLGDRLIVEVLDEEETTFSGIVLPDTAKEKPQRGKVLAVGPGSRDENGNPTWPRYWSVTAWCVNPRWGPRKMVRYWIVWAWRSLRPP